jgi:hypothetical protein
LSAGLIIFLEEVNAWDPVSRILDGTVASKPHDLANPSSDHRPVPHSGFGIVRAADIGELDDPQGDYLAEKARATHDPRIKYWIHDGRMFSSYSTSTRKAWEWGPYNGYNDHLKHNHISVYVTADRDTSPWNLGLTSETEENMLTQGDKGNAVKKLQSALNKWNAGLGLDVDGVYGPNTTAAVTSYQSAADLDKTGNTDGVTMALLMEYLPDAGSATPIDAYTKAQSDAKYALKSHPHKVTIS